MDMKEERFTTHIEGAVKNRKIAKVVELTDDSKISSIKSIVTGVIDIINNPKSSVKELKELIELDPPLSARVLKTANSAYYGFPQRISDIEQAVIWIGLDELKELALRQKVCEIFAKDECIEGYSRRLLWKHSIGVAMLAKMIYQKELMEKGANIYAAGLLHDIGIIIEDQFLQEDFRFIISKIKNEEKNLTEAEYEVLGYNHAEVGKALTEYWDLSDELVMSIGHHHNPPEDLKYFSRMALTLYVSDYLCQKAGIGYGDETFPDKTIFNKCLMKLGLVDYTVKSILKELKEEIAKMESKRLF
ncbi:hypothetical protein ES703_60595 [subsurface metagenome]